MKSRSALSISLLSIFLLSFVGCQQRAASKLLGRWEGRPDSAERQAAREAKKYGDDKPNIADEEGAEAQSRSSEQVTDWESYDVKIVIDFVSSDQLEMSLHGELPKSGSWKVVTTAPSACTIEVQTESDSNEAEPGRVERRRFELLLDERDGACVGFQLNEAGADARLGAIYFQRLDSSSASLPN